MKWIILESYIRAPIYNNIKAPLYIGVPIYMSEPPMYQRSYLYIRGMETRVSSHSGHSSVCQSPCHRVRTEHEVQV